MSKAVARQNVHSPIVDRILAPVQTHKQKKLPVATRKQEQGDVHLEYDNVLESVNKIHNNVVSVLVDYL